MKKLSAIYAVLAAVTLLTGCTSVVEKDDVFEDDITKYFATSEKDTTFVLEFLNQSNKPLKIVAYVAETQNMINQYYPTLTSSDVVVEAGESYDFKFNVSKLIKNYTSDFSVGINCYEKEWHWWNTIEPEMKNSRVRIIVDNDQVEGGEMFFPSFEYQDKFFVSEFTVDYEGQKYMAYRLENMPEKYKSFFDTRIFSLARNKNYGNIYDFSCKAKIEELLNAGEFTILDLDGYKVLMLNIEPTDLNNYLSPDDYDFIYEIVNNSSDKIIFSNLIMDENSKLLSYTDDIELEKGQSYQFKYKLADLEKIYGKNSLIGMDVRKEEHTQWTRGWANPINHYNEKYTLVILDETENYYFDSFDLWSELTPIKASDDFIIY